MVLNTLKFNNIHNFVLINIFNGLRKNYIISIVNSFYLDSKEFLLLVWEQGCGITNKLFFNCHTFTNTKLSKPTNAFNNVPSK